MKRPFKRHRFTKVLGDRSSDGRWPAECSEVPRSSRLMGRCQQQVALEQQRHQQHCEQCHRQCRVHRHAQRAGILSQCRRQRCVGRHPNCGTRQQLAVNMRCLRNPGNTNQHHAKQRGNTQPDRPRPGAKLALGHSLHVTSSMTRFPRERTQSVTKSRILSHYASGTSPDHPFSARVTAGTISNRSPTAATSATSKIGASGSLLMAITVRAPFMPTRCWIAPEIPTAI